MHYRRIDAVAFGPFRAEELELAPGMNVIHGRNESGKSSWHAALEAGLCGIRRARGIRKDDRRFAERHKPWDGDGDWEIGARIELNKNGRCVELRHDLARKVGFAEDADIAGCDYSDQLVYDGAVDGSLWLGLNRQSFRATACVRQADILGVRESAAFLQTALQEAATGAAKDVTVAAALKRLNDYHRQYVGTPRAPSKPLSQAKAMVKQKYAALREAVDKRDRYLERQAYVDQLGEEAKQTGLRLTAVRAVAAERKALERARALSRAKELELEFPEGAPPALPADEDVANTVDQALAARG